MVEYNVYEKDGVASMLKRFEVENYHGFKDRIVMDFTGTKSYSYSKELIKNKLVKNSTVFGENGSGKSSLCLALMDITLHLLDKEKIAALSQIYTYLGNESKQASFKYVFQFNNKEVEYSYRKVSPLMLTYEEFAVNGKVVLIHDYNNEKNNFISIPGATYINTIGMQPELSCVKYVYNNTIHDDKSALSQMMDYVGGMLYFRSLRQGNEYVGYKLGAENLDDIILNNNALEAFNRFLDSVGLHYSLIPIKHPNGNKLIGIKFDNGKVVSFNDIVSSGTMALKLFYCWLLDFPNLTFLIIDEFDAFYSIKTARAVLRMINSFDNMQSLVTTHNVTLLDTDYTRPDCTFLLDRNGILSLSQRSKKELRRANNIEKMYRAGEFDLGEGEEKK